MAFILQLVLRIEKSISQGLRYIFKLFSRLNGQNIPQKLLFHRSPESPSIYNAENCRYLQDVECSRTDIQIKREAKVRLKSIKLKSFNKKCKKRIETGWGIVVQDSKKAENLLKTNNALKRQVNGMGDSSDSLTSVVPPFKPESKLEENRDASVSNKESNRLKINRVSKYTISLDMLSTKADGILKFLDELKDNPLKFSHQLHKDVLEKARPKNNLRDIPNGSGEIKYKNKYFPEMKSYLATGYKEATYADSCYCLQTNQCLLCVDSEDDIDCFVDRKLSVHKELYSKNYALYDELLTPEELASVETGSDADSCYCLQTNQCLLCVDSEDDIDCFVDSKLSVHKELYGKNYALYNELLTPEELASVETGSDDTWLYNPVKSNLISISA